MVKKLTINSVLEPFLTRPKGNLHLADISRQLKVPHPTARQWLNALEDKGVLKKAHKGRLTIYSLNLENPSIIDYLVMAEKNKFINKCEKWPVLGEFAPYINRNTNENIRALIFGSASESFDAANDIDLLIVGKQNLKNLKTFAKHLGKELHIINTPNLGKVSKSLKNEIIKSHMLIKGSEDFVRWMLW